MQWSKARFWAISIQHMVYQAYYEDEFAANHIPSVQALIGRGAPDHTRGQPATASMSASALTGTPKRGVPSTFHTKRCARVVRPW